MYFSSGRLTRPNISHEASSSTRVMNSSTNTSSATHTQTETSERRKSAPKHENTKKHKHRLVTGTTTLSVILSFSSLRSPDKTTSKTNTHATPDTGAFLVMK